MNQIRPDALSGFVGQEKAKRILQVLIGATRSRGEPAPHMLMSGPPGLGKTTLARIVAHESGGRLVEVLGSAIKTPAEMSGHFLSLQKSDVLFVDEIHALPRKIEEIMYSALEDGLVAQEPKGYGDLMKQLGITGEKAKTMHKLPSFTLVGATTLLGLVSPPLRSRFTQVLQLEPYTLEDLDRIVGSACDKMSFPLNPQLVREISIRSRGTARIAINNLLWTRDFFQSNGESPDLDSMEEAFVLQGIDRHGLTNVDRRYLKKLAEADIPIGVETVASCLGESIETLEAGIEPFLMQQGFVIKTARGRLLGEKARMILEEDTRARVGADT